MSNKVTTIILTVLVVFSAAKQSLAVTYTTATLAITGTEQLLANGWDSGVVTNITSIPGHDYLHDLND